MYMWIQYSDEYAVKRAVTRVLVNWSNGITQRTKDDKYEHTEKVSSFYSVKLCLVST